MKPSHYAVRDLHAAEPADYEFPAWDVLALIDGKVYYSEDIYDTEIEANAIIDRLRILPLQWDWTDNPVPPAGLKLSKPHWVPAKAPRVTV